MSAGILTWPMRPKAESPEERDKRPGIRCSADIFTLPF
jgi:hypothetical protein